MIAKQFYAEKECPENTEAWTKGFDFAVQNAAQFMVQLGSPELSILLRGMFTAQVNPETGKPLHIEQDEKEMNG